MASAPPLPVRLPDRQRRLYRQVAASAGMTLSEFTREALAREATRRMAGNLDQETAERVREILEETPA